MFGLPLFLPGNNMVNYIQQQNAINDPQVIPHLANMLAAIKNTKHPGDIIHLSNLVKQTEPRPQSNHHKIHQTPIFQKKIEASGQAKEFYVHKFGISSQKLQMAGYSLTKQEILLIDSHLIELAQKNNAKQIRFFGKILGSEKDYYIIQGAVVEINTLQDITKGAQKRGEGTNFYTFWASNSLVNAHWVQLPLITPEHIKVSRKIKKYFTGQLERPINSQPHFNGYQKHYLKAQLVRMTSSLEIVPKGLYKPNDENPKVVQFEDQPKIPQFAELSTLQTWVHRNQNLLHLGRCTHFIDPSLPEDQIQAATAELAEKDPEIERLRGITQDKLPEGSPFGVENIWQARIVGNTQVFQKEQATNVYGVVVLKNLYWPGWVTIGYKSGYANHYVGYGLKWTQPNWNQYQNANLPQQAEDCQQYHEPNPKNQPVPVPIQPLPEEVPEE